MKTKKVRYKTQDSVEISGIIDSPDSLPRGCIVLCHGITADKDENGKFITLSNLLCDAGFEVLRFDFRGHGESDLNSEKVTIAGELLDIIASVSYTIRKYSTVGLLAASFGAGPAILYTVDYPTLIKTLVLWNPVLDYEQTFLKPKLPWGKTFFNEEGYKELKNNGFITIPEKNFRLGRQLVQEFSKYKPFEELNKVQCPVLTIHGTEDTKVPYWVSKKYGKPNEMSQFISVKSNHGFGDQKNIANQKTVEWFKKTIPIFVEK